MTLPSSLPLPLLLRHPLRAENLCIFPLLKEARPLMQASKSSSSLFSLDDDFSSIRSDQKLSSFEPLPMFSSTTLFLLAKTKAILASSSS
jgi:hypothetical protein